MKVNDFISATININLILITFLTIICFVYQVNINPYVLVGFTFYAAFFITIIINKFEHIK